jgi:DNA ligase D-like protein (predicted ligase)
VPRRKTKSGSTAREWNAAGKPTFHPPLAAVVVQTLPEGEDWLYEVKLDGYRALLLKDGERVQIRSRNDKDLATLSASVVAAARKLRARQAVVDGELVAIDPQGRPSFQALQHRGTYPNHRIVFYAFDLLHLDGRALVTEPLWKRRSLLPDILAGTGILISQDLPGNLADIIRTVKAMGLEGVIAKRKNSPYVQDEQSPHWLKLKLERQQEFVIGGYRAGGSSGLDALLVGYYDDGKLHFAAKVRAGLIPHVRRELLAKLKPLHVTQCPFVNLPSEGGSRWGGGVSAEDMEEMQWTQPQLVAQIRFVEWTAEGRLRHSAFLALRLDKDPKSVLREP